MTTRPLHLTLSLVYLLLALAPPILGEESTSHPSGPSVERLRRSVRYLASNDLRGRLAGSWGERMAGSYIARAFEEAGLEPAGDNGTWFQHFPVQPYRGIGTGNRVIVRVGETTHKLRPIADFVPAPYGPNGLVRGKVIFAGQGIVAPKYEHNDYSDLSVAGCIVICREGHPGEGKREGPFTAPGDRQHGSLTTKARLAAERGARALVVIRRATISGPLPGPYGRNILGSLPIPVIRTTTGVWENILKGVGEQLLDRPGSLSGWNVEIETSFRRPTRQAANVLGFLPGTDPQRAGEVIVVGAHYDHLGHGFQGSFEAPPGNIHNGADDNASGTAALLELARALTRSPQRAARSILFAAFSGEELGLLGSSHYVRHPSRPLERTIAMLNLDMVGRVRRNRLQINGIGTSPGFETLVKAANEPSGFELILGPHGFGPSDHSSFYARKIPVLFFFSGVHGDYHRSSDDPEHLDYSGLAKVTSLVGRTVEQLANHPDRPDYLETGPAPGSRPRGGARVSLGIIPDYGGSNGTGLMLHGVRKNSPAARAGLRAEDRIVQMDRTAIQSIHDLAAWLRSAEPGQHVSIIVERAGKRLVLETTLSD